MKKENIERKKEIVDKTIKFMQDNAFKNKISIRQVAKECGDGIGHESLSLMLYRVLGRTYSSLLTTIRIEQIYNAIEKYPKKNTKEIAEYFGTNATTIYAIMSRFTDITASKAKHMYERTRISMKEKKKVRKFILEKRIGIVKSLLEDYQEKYYRTEIELKIQQRQIKTNPIYIEQCENNLYEYQKGIQVCNEELDKLEEEEIILNESNNTN